ncbi:MAG: helix-turn-helix domain-containing protein [Patescibacteria group bacterium]|jgi:excisionase family DNA binding protein
MQHDYVSTIEAAKITGLNRTQIFRLIKVGKLPAARIGRNYIIKKDDLGILTAEITPKEKKNIEHSVDKVFEEYGDVLKKLGEE